MRRSLPGHLSDVVVAGGHLSRADIMCKSRRDSDCWTRSRGCEAIEVDEGPVTKVLGFYIVDSFTGLSGGDIF